MRFKKWILLFYMMKIRKYILLSSFFIFLSFTITSFAADAVDMIIKNPNTYSGIMMKNKSHTVKSATKLAIRRVSPRYNDYYCPIAGTPSNYPNHIHPMANDDVGENGNRYSTRSGIWAGGSEGIMCQWGGNASYDAYLSIEYIDPTSRSIKEATRWSFSYGGYGTGENLHYRYHIFYPDQTMCLYT